MLSDFAAAYLYTEIKDQYEEYHEKFGKFDKLWEQIMRLDILVPY